MCLLQWCSIVNCFVFSFLHLIVACFTSARQLRHALRKIMEVQVTETLAEAAVLYRIKDLAVVGSLCVITVLSLLFVCFPEQKNV